MPTDERTGIRVDYEVWRYVHSRKQPGDSMNDVLRRELGIPVPDEAVETAVRDMDWPENYGHSDARERAVVGAALALRDGGPLGIDAIDAAAVDAVPTIDEELAESSRKRLWRATLQRLPWVGGPGQGGSRYSWDNSAE